MALLDRFLADLKANVPIQKRNVTANKQTMRRIAGLPTDVKSKWVDDYLNTYNVVVGTKGKDEAEKLASRIAWCKVPQKYKRAAIEEGADETETSNDPFHDELRTADWDVVAQNIDVGKDSFADTRGVGPEFKTLDGSVKFTATVKTPSADKLWPEADLSEVMPFFKAETVNQLPPDSFDVSDIDLVERPNSRRTAPQEDGTVTISVEFDVRLR